MLISSDGERAGQQLSPAVLLPRPALPMPEGPAARRDGRGAERDPPAPHRGVLRPKPPQRGHPPAPAGWGELVVPRDGASWWSRSSTPRLAGGGHGGGSGAPGTAGAKRERQQTADMICRKLLELCNGG